MKKITEIGEIDFIKRIAASFSKNLPHNIVGIGDDAAVITLNQERALLISTDLLIENVHFLRHAIAPQDLGYKTAAVNLSDIAAMGGAPKYIFLSIALSLDITDVWLNKFLNGLKKPLEKYHILLLGGDTTRSVNDIAINITILGEAHPTKIKYRSQANPGDVVCVTDNLGNSAAGLFCIQHNYKNSEASKKLITKHNKPNCNIEEGLFLAQNSQVHAMMDISDGINSDLQRIMEQSKCGVDVQLNNLPISEELKQIAANFQFKALEMAATGGEDYCLLVSIDNSSYSDIAQQFQKKFHQPLTKIGEITKRKNHLRYFLGNKPYRLTMQSFSHF